MKEVLNLCKFVVLSTTMYHFVLCCVCVVILMGNVFTYKHTRKKKDGGGKRTSECLLCDEIYDFLII
jgi:hypothetical protein